MNTTTSKYWVSMTDKFMSGWGRAEGQINKLVIECDTYDEAEKVYNNVIKRSEMKYVNICMNKPRYNSNYYLTSYRTKVDVPKFFK